MASLPFRRSTQSSTKSIITGSSEAMGLFRVLLDMTCSWRSCRAACDCWTPMSSCARLLDNGKQRSPHLAQRGYRTEYSQACCAVEAPCWAVVDRGSNCFSRGLGFRAGGATQRAGLLTAGAPPSSVIFGCAYMTKRGSRDQQLGCHLGIRTRATQRLTEQAAAVPSRRSKCSRSHGSDATAPFTVAA